RSSAEAETGSLRQVWSTCPSWRSTGGKKVCSGRPCSTIRRIRRPTPTPSGASLLVVLRRERAAPDRVGTRFGGFDRWSLSPSGQVLDQLSGSRYRLEPGERDAFDLPDPLAGDGHDLPHVLQRRFLGV